MGSGGILWDPSRAAENLDQPIPGGAGPYRGHQCSQYSPHSGNGADAREWGGSKEMGWIPWKQRGDPDPAADSWLCPPAREQLRRSRHSRTFLVESGVGELWSEMQAGRSWGDTGGGPHWRFPGPGHFPNPRDFPDPGVPLDEWLRGWMSSWQCPKGAFAMGATRVGSVPCPHRRGGVSLSPSHPFIPLPPPHPQIPAGFWAGKPPQIPNILAKALFS